MSNNNIGTLATEFLKKFFRIYLEDRNFPQTIAMFHPEITWIGTGAHEMCKGYDDAIRLMNDERDSWDGRFKILEESYQAIQIDEKCCTVFGTLKISEDGLNTILIDMDSRFSVVCVLEDGEIKVLHIHFSVANAAQNEGEFAHKSLIENYNRILEEKFIERTEQLKERERSLHISQKRYEIALAATEITMFEYDIVTKDLILFDKDAMMYGVPNIIPDGMETFISRRIVEPESASVYREMYRRIHEGEPVASCYVNARDAEGGIHNFELKLTTIYDDRARPVRAIGVRRNVSSIRQLEKEREYGKAMASDKSFLFEADLDADAFLSVDAEWASAVGINNDFSFTKNMINSTKSSISEEHRDLIMSNCQAEYIARCYEQGNTLLSFLYRRAGGGREPRWFEATINIIKDQGTGHLNIRFYNTDINDRKVKEEKALYEQRLYETMISRAIIAYEVNITKDLAVKGHGNWDELFGIKVSSSYSAMISAFADMAVHPADGPKFAATFNSDNVLREFRSGKQHLMCQYRKKMPEVEYQWVNCILHMFEDHVTGDIKGFSYIEDIDDQKRKELALRYDAEHDQMTRLYNKTTAETMIRDFLETPCAKKSKHAFIVIDVDKFKYVNDNFGHPYGDTVLADVADKIRSTFREQDIVGRVGGDEFCVFMKNVHSDKVVFAKVNEMCAKVMRTYSKDGKSATMSLSVGIAFTGVHGDDYVSLYRHADKAMYDAKKNGRNRYSI